MAETSKMVVYADTTAVVELVSKGRRSELLAKVWDAAGRVVTAATLYPEARSCIRVLQGDGVLDERAAAAAIERLGRVVADAELVTVDDSLATRAAVLAESHGLASDAAIHLAAALVADAPRVAVATLDPGFGIAAVEAGLATIPQVRVTAGAG